MDAGARRRFRPIPIAALAAILAAALCGRCQARTIRVSLDGTGDFASIQQAIQASQDGDSVEVSPGTYFERLRFDGRAITVRSREGPEVTVIDAERVASVVVMDFLEGPETVLDGFTLCHGLGTPIRADLGSAARGARAGARSEAPDRQARFRHEQAEGDRAERGRFGGGLLLLTASPTLRNLVIRDCRAEYGGGLYSLQTSARLEHCRLIKNTAGLGAGACLEMTYRALLDGCEFRSNRGVVGAGLALVQGSAEIIGGRFESNLGTEGGALHLFDCAGATRVSGTVFFGNQAPEGPVALAIGSELRMESCTAAANGFADSEPASVAFGPGSAGALLRTIVAANQGGSPLRMEGATIEVHCCALWPNADPSDSPSGDILRVWPGFCDLSAGDLRLRADSPCLPERSPPGCGLIGALPRGCGGTGADGERAE